MSDTSQQALAATPPPIPGDPIEPPPKEVADILAKVDSRGSAAGSAYRAFLRFTHANATLLAAGTTYYAFLALFAILVFTFGVTALVGGQELADTVTEAVDNAFPGLVGDQGVSPATLEQVGQTTSIIGLLVLLFSGSGAMMAMSRSVHLIYGAPKDPRNVVIVRLRLLAWMLLLVPLIGLAFVPSFLISHFADPVLEFLNLQGGPWGALLVALTAVISVVLNGLVIWLILGHMGGIRPAHHARLVGTAAGAVGIEVLKYLLTWIIGWSLGKPQYGAFAAPIAMLLVLYLECVVLYVAAAITAGTAVATSDPEHHVTEVAALPA